MAGRKQKSEQQKLEELDAAIQRQELRIEQGQKRLEQLKEKRTELLSRVILGHIREAHLPFPEVRSLLDDLHHHVPAKAEQQEPAEEQKKDSPANIIQDAGRISELKVRVTAKEKAQIQANMTYADIPNFNRYAKKMLLDGYVIIWNLSEISRIKKELGYLNRNMNQIVKRANLTGNIYRRDFEAFQEDWFEIKKQLQSLFHWVEAVCSRE